MTYKTSAFIAVILIAAYAAIAVIEPAEGGEHMNLKSPEFENNKFIPSKYTCEGDDINPALTIENIPQGTKSLALIMDDPDAPMGTWVHWVAFDIPVVASIKENSVPGKQGINNSGKRDYHGPCPPSGVHRYFFKIYALDTILNLKEGITKAVLEEAMQGHILDKAELVGLYKRKN
jgi:Raf kinase inhibitor-like YbhB/YbcL family protein